MDSEKGLQVYLHSPMTLSGETNETDGSIHHSKMGECSQYLNRHEDAAARTMFVFNEMDRHNLGHGPIQAINHNSAGLL